jgi:hypothetical protein
LSENVLALMILSGRWVGGAAKVPLLKGPMGEGFGWVFSRKIGQWLVFLDFRKID